MELIKPIIWVIILGIFIILVLTGIGTFIIWCLGEQGLSYYGQKRKKGNDEDFRR